MRTARNLVAVVCVALMAVAVSGLAPHRAAAASKVTVAPQDSVWYLAEGSTKWGFDCYITIENPTTVDLTAKITYMTTEGQRVMPDLVLPEASQTHVSPYDSIGEMDFSTRVECLEGAPIAVDREMFWQGQGQVAAGAHCSIGVTGPAKTWYLPEGSSKWGFETWLLIQNPNPAQAVCTLTYMIEGQGPVSVNKVVPANSRRSFFMADDIGAADASIKVVANLPVIPERAMYRNNRREGHDSIGTTTPATGFYLAEGTTDWGFTTYVLVQNPNTSPARVSITYMTPQGPVPQPQFTMPASSRKTIRVNDFLANRDLSTRVSADVPVIAERAMYWDNGTGEAMHDSIGISGPHERFFLPDGRTDSSFETWTCVQNPGSTAVEIRVIYLPFEGGTTVGFDDTLAPQSRATYSLQDAVGPNQSFATVVICLTSGKGIIAERAIYQGFRDSGTETIGGFYDAPPTAPKPTFEREVAAGAARRNAGSLKR